MAKIYISYSTPDKDIAFQISKGLADLGHDILIDTQELTPGIDWRQKLSNALKSSDGIISLITENSTKSQFVMSEIGAARAYIDNDNSKFLIPVVFNNVQIPLILQDIQCLFTDKNSIKEAIDRIHHAITSLSLKQKAEQEKQAKKIEKIEHNILKYVDDAMTRLREREARNKSNGNICYISGFLCLLGGVFFGIIGVTEFLSTESISTEIHWTNIIILTIKTAVIIGLLIACSKYLFTLGKSYTNESLKNADRSHAISFGKLYLDVYGSTPKWEDLKEAFQYWNINNESSFTKLDTSQYDPKFVELFVELSKMASSKDVKK